MSATTRGRLPAGEPSLWLTGGALVAALAMIGSLVAFILVQGAATFWPGPVVRVTLAGGKVVMGEPTRVEDFKLRTEDLSTLAPEARAAAEDELARRDGFARRRLYRTANLDLSASGQSYTWVNDFAVRSRDEPAWALVIERESYGRFVGTPAAYVADGKPTTTDPAEAWAAFLRQHPESRALRRERNAILEDDLGALNRLQQQADVAAVQAKLSAGHGSAAHDAALERVRAVKAAAAAERKKHDARVKEIDARNARYALRVLTADGQTKDIPVAEVVRAYPANQLTTSERLGVYASRWWEFLTDDPREANSEGGVFPAIWGTVALTLIMSVAVVPFGVLAALYLREYAKPGFVLSTVRIAINNLAGVPSVVFGVFGLGLFCYVVGGWVDQTAFAAERAHTNGPVFGKGGLVWAALTLALLTLPVVIVATEEALAAVPNSMREGSYACGASKWQTIRRIVLPRAAPGILTGLILAVARAAGEVAPLMLVGAVKLAPELPVDGVFPYLHPQRSFMHLGFHIFDLGFQSRDAEASKPMVFTTTLLLIGLVLALNLLAVWLRARFRRQPAGPF